MLLVLSIFIVAFAVGSVIAEEQKESAEIKMLSEDTLKNGDNIELQLVDAKGNPIASQNINISFEANGKLENYSVVTDKDGNCYLVLFNFIVQEFSGFFKLGMNCTFSGLVSIFFLCGWGGEISFQMLSDKCYIICRLIICNIERWGKTSIG